MRRVIAPHSASHRRENLWRPSHRVAVVHHFIYTGEIQLLQHIPASMKKLPPVEKLFAR
ncbi:MAG: hypothetical protein WCP07_00875 [bacterium]